MPTNILKGVDAIIFDLGGVILNLDYQLTIEAFKNFGAKEFDKLYSQASQEGIFDLYETGVMSSDDFLRQLATFLPENVTRLQVIEAWNAMLLDLPSKRLDVLKSLSDKYKLFLFSNTNELHYTSFTKELEKTYGDAQLLESYFIQCYFSHLVGKRKPNKDAFEHVLAAHNLEANTTLFIDDSIQHIEGAKLMGINTYHLKGEDIIDIFGVQQ